MSHIADVIIKFPTLDEKLQRLVVETDIRWATSPSRLKPLGQSWDEDDEQAHSQWGGNRVPQVWLAAGSFNYLQIEEFLGWLASLPWEYPDELQVLIKDEHDDGFALYTLNPDRRTWHKHNTPPQS